MLAVAVTSGSVRDVLSVVMSLKKGVEKLPPAAATFMQRLQNLTTDLKLLMPAPSALVGSFRSNLSPPIVIPDEKLQFAMSSVCTNGAHLFLWDGVRCAIAKVGTGFHGTIAGHQVMQNADIEKQLRDRLQDQVYEVTNKKVSAQVVPRLASDQERVRRVRTIRKSMIINTTASRNLAATLSDGPSDNASEEIPIGFEADVLGEETHTVEGVTLPFYQVKPR